MESLKHSTIFEFTRWGGYGTQLSFRLEGGKGEEDGAAASKFYEACCEPSTSRRYRVRLEGFGHCFEVLVVD